MMNGYAKNYTLYKDVRLLNLHWMDGETTVHPLTWMRDNCQCQECFNPATQARALLMKDLDLQVEPNFIQLNLESDKLLVKWNDDHDSEFDGDFLRRRSFTENRQKIRTEVHLPPAPELWNSEALEQGKKIPQYNYSELISSDNSLLQWLMDIERIGLTLVRNAPANEGALSELTKRVSYPSMTNYGHYFKVKSKPNASNLAYTAMKLGFHQDLVYYEKPPGVQLLHCIAQSDKVLGGENEFVDTFHVANVLKKEYPKAYEIIARTNVDFYDYGTDALPDFHLVQRSPTFQMDRNGTLMGCRFSNHGRDSYMNIPATDVQPFYEALKLFHDLMYSKENLVQLKMKTGDIVVFNNNRVLHGRNGYECLDGADRFLLGCYLEWDEVHSRIRTLKASLEKSKEIC